MALLEIENLQVHFDTDDGVVRAVDGVSYSVDAGKSLGIVGESGSGKSVSNLTILGLTRASNARFSGKVLFEGRDLLALSEEEMRALRERDRPITVSEETDLPEPDSPTMPSVCPRSTE